MKAAVRRIDPRDVLQANEAVLEARDLVVVRAGRRILDVGHLAVHAGRTLAVVGPNGAGKSTLLLALARLVRADQGVIRFAGRPLVPGDDLAYRRRIGLVLPAPLLLSTSVLENVIAGLRFRGVPAVEARGRAEPWLGRLGIAHLRDRAAGQLSTGEAQRVSLARAFVLDPELLLLDEPFAFLDPGTRAELTDDFERLRRGTSTTCVLVTHDLSEAIRLGDSLAVLLDGRIRQCDDPARVMAEPADEGVAAFLGTPAGVRGRVVAARDGLVVVDTSARPQPDLRLRTDAILAATHGGTLVPSPGPAEEAPPAAAMGDDVGATADAHDEAGGLGGS